MSEELNGPSHSRPWGAQTAEQVRPAPAETGQQDVQTATRPRAAAKPPDGESEELIKTPKPLRKRLLLLAVAVVLLLIGALFAAIGGMLSAAYFKKEVPPALGGNWVPPLPPQ